MALAPNLESQLEAARLGALLPVLLELRVVRCEDLEFMDEGDIEKREDITMVQKRRFLEWRAKFLEARAAQSSCWELSSSSSAFQDAGSLQSTIFQVDCEQHHEAQIKHPQASRAGSKGNASSVAMPQQTPRSRAMPLLEVLREVEHLDIALQTERERNAALTAELQGERSAMISAELKFLKMEEELQEERKRSAQLAKELQEERERSSKIKGVASVVQEELQKEKHSTEESYFTDKESRLTIATEQLQFLKIELKEERERSAKITTELQEALLAAETWDRIDRQAQDAQERNVKCTTELQEERERSAAIIEELHLKEEKHFIEKDSLRSNHSRDIAMLEEMLQSILAENDQLKGTVSAWEATKLPESVPGTLRSIPQTSTSEEPLDEPEMELPSGVSLLSRVQRWNADVRGAAS